MNHDAGRGGEIVVTVQLEDGKELPFMLDTGSPVTCLDKSLEPMLGKSKGTISFNTLDGPKMDATIYRAPRLYLQDVRLMTGDLVYAVDLKTFSSEAARPILGVIGMDILKNYCIQLDFRANKIRFLDDSWNSDKSNWGKYFILREKQGAEYINDNLSGMFDAGSIVDTGCFYDGWLHPKLFQRWFDTSKPPKKGHAQYPNAILGGEIYTNVALTGDVMNLPFVRNGSNGQSHQALLIKRTDKIAGESNACIQNRGSDELTIFPSV
jgi:hypothetical protein